MTVRYASTFATHTGLGAFTNLLFRWRGSVWKLIWSEYLLFITFFYIFTFIYRYVLDEQQQRYFESIANYCEKSKRSLNMAFVLGFFVTSIVSKWWQMYNIIPWPDSVALLVNAYLRTQSESTRELKTTIMRLCNLSLMLTFLKISPALKLRYPTFDKMVDDLILTESEKDVLENISESTDHTSNWLPITWAAELIMKADAKNEVVDSRKIVDELNKFRNGCALLLEYENSTVPLAYIQVVTVSVYAYFFSCLFGRQWLIRDNELRNLDLYFPFLTTLEFIFYMGWLKVAESLINPFGCDDDDFELDKIIQRHRQVTYTMVSATEEGKFDIDHFSFPKSHRASIYLGQDLNVVFSKWNSRKADTKPPENSRPSKSTRWKKSIELLERL